MEAKEKAVEIQKAMYEKIFDIDYGFNVEQDQARRDASIRCALICVEQMLHSDLKAHSNESGRYVKFWFNVRQELLKL